MCNWISVMLIISSALVLSGYIFWIHKTLPDGLPKSLSATYYALGGKDGRGWLFQVSLALCVALLLPAWVESTTENLMFLGFLSCAASMFVAAAPNYGDDLAYEVHMGAAIISCTLAVIWCVLSGYSLVLLGAMALGAILCIRHKHRAILIGELTALGAVYVSLILSIFVE